MKIYISCFVAIVLSTIVAGGQEQIKPTTSTNEGSEVLTRGPVHEAFAETVIFNPLPGIIAPKALPRAIEELPPEHRPEGTNVTWIPGYFAWDDERNDFLWISGIWRSLPPGRQWVPGYWFKVTQGVQWTSGYWADSKLTEVEYLPEPPQSIETGPNIAAASVDETWLPGNWVWQSNRYAWRPGYWITGNTGWTWIPARYVWTPRGYVYSEGYYDYSLARRGVLFAPVYFDQSYYSRRSSSYTPSLVINPAIFAASLFLRPSYQHYYFGDYYATNYGSSGYYPSYSYHSAHHAYDPIYAQQRWEHRSDRRWEQNYQANFATLRDQESLRPPRTWAAQQLLNTNGSNGLAKQIIVAAPLTNLINTKDGLVRFQSVNQAERQQMNQHSRTVQQFREDRQRLETIPQTPIAGSSTLKPELFSQKIPVSPITGKAFDQLGRDNVPPTIHKLPNPDPKIVPQPRKGVNTPLPVTTLKPTTEIPRTPATPVVPQAMPLPPAITPKAVPKPAPVVPPVQVAPRTPVVPKPLPVPPATIPKIVPKVTPVVPPAQVPPRTSVPQKTAPPGKQPKP